jgi:hypothetical protein
VLANLGEEPPLYRETMQQWLLIDLLTALRAGDLRENLTQDLMEAIRSHADDLWSSVVKPTVLQPYRPGRVICR